MCTHFSLAKRLNLKVIYVRVGVTTSALYVVYVYTHRYSSTYICVLYIYNIYICLNEEI